MGVVMMSIKNVSIRIEQEMLEKLSYVADYQGRSVNSHVLALIREDIAQHEAKHGKIEGNIKPAENIKPGRKK